MMLLAAGCSRLTLTPAPVESPLPDIRLSADGGMVRASGNFATGAGGRPVFLRGRQGSGGGDRWREGDGLRRSHGGREREAAIGGGGQIGALPSTGRAGGSVPAARASKRLKAAQAKWTQQEREWRSPPRAPVPTRWPWPSWKFSAARRHTDGSSTALANGTGRRAGRTLQRQSRGAAGPVGLQWHRLAQRCGREPESRELQEATNKLEARRPVTTRGCRARRRSGGGGARADSAGQGRTGPLLNPGSENEVNEAESQVRGA